MSRTVYIFFAFIFLSAFKQSDVFFTPSLDCENHIINQINKAKTSIDVVMYSLNNDNIVEALINADKNGIKVRILADKQQASGKYSKVKYLHQHGINIRVKSKHKIEHNKFAIFDNKIIETGSYNWTNPASAKNSENCNFLTEEHIINKYIKRFNYLWKINTKQKSDEWFKKT